MNLPTAPVINSDAIFTLREDGKVVGTLTISRGSIEWYSARWKNPARLTWSQFDQRMHDEEPARRKRQ